jgi:hypothetical protein
MSGDRRLDALAAQILRGAGADASFANLTAGEQDHLVNRLIDSDTGRRWLRGSEPLSERLAVRLLEYEDDFRRQGQDSTLDHVVAAAPYEALIRHAAAIASGSAAPALWRRLREPDRIADVARRIAGADEPDAAEATAIHLLLDRSDPYALGEARRQRIALEFLTVESDAARGIAAEYLARSAGAILAGRLASLAFDPSARVRGYAWLAAFRAARDTAANQAMNLLGNETIAVDIRKSALTVAGEALPTEMLVDLLAYFVVHPNAELALEAANLLQCHHRHPEIAIPAAGSPHPEVREIANRLMDPYRGSPAAGGSRPGDPLREDPLMKLLRQIEEAEDETKA